MDTIDRPQWGPSVSPALKEFLDKIGPSTEPLSEEDLLSAEKEFRRHYVCYHRIDLGGGMSTPGRMTHEQGIVINSIPRHVGPGCRVVDIGCRDGLFTLKAVESEAAHVLAVDNDPSDIFTDIVVPRFGLRDVEYVVQNYLDLASHYNSQFDVAIFSGVLYHLRYPFFGLKKVFELLKEDGVMILETAFIDEFNGFPILLCPIGDESPYEATSISFFNRMGLKDTVMSLGFTVDEIVEEFTYPRTNRSLYDELPFTYGRAVHNIGRLIWVCRKHRPRIDKWQNTQLTPEHVSRYWNLTHDEHHLRPTPSNGE